VVQHLFSTHEASYVKVVEGRPIVSATKMWPNESCFWLWPRRQPPETETLTIFIQTRPRRDVRTSRDCLETKSTILATRNCDRQKLFCCIYHHTTVIMADKYSLSCYNHCYL